MAVERDGRILAMSSDVCVDVGAYSTTVSAGMEPLQNRGLMPGPEEGFLPGATDPRRRHNKTPVGPYRAVGRPTASASSAAAG